MSERYKGRVIDPRAFELSDGTGWTAEVYVAEDVGPDTIDTQFLLKERFLTKEAALESASAVGRREVDKRVRSVDIQAVIDEATHLPSTHRRGLGHNTDDIAASIDGRLTKVPGPENPEDRFSS